MTSLIRSLLLLVFLFLPSSQGHSSVSLITTQLEMPEIMDVLFLPPMRKNQLLFYVDCLKANKPDSELVVITDSTPRAGYYESVHHAWRANRQTEKFQQIPVAGIRCEAQGD